MTDSVNNEKFIKVNIRFLIRDKKTQYNFYLKIRDRFIKYTNENYDNQDQLEKLLIKGEEHVYLSKTEYKGYISNRITERKNLKNPKRFSKEELVKSIQEDQSLLKDIFHQTGFDDEKIEFAKTLQEKNLKIIKANKKFFKQFSTFQKEKTNASGFKKLLVTSTVIGMLEQHESTSAYSHEKMSMAIMLDGINLTEAEYWESFEKNTDELSEKIKTSPTKTIGMLPKVSAFASPDLISMVMQYHEKPDGTGYPLGIKKNQIMPFSALLHVADDFSTQLIQKNMKNSEIRNIFAAIENKYMRIAGNNYTKAVTCLYKALKKMEVI